jgi:putative membrane protein insertion efficiency factor
MGFPDGASRILGWGITAIIRGYQLFVAPILPPSCRFYPSCSHYAAEAVERHGPWHGSLLAFCRLLRCHPWGGSGYDPVPPAAPAGRRRAHDCGAAHPGRG